LIKWNISNIQVEIAFNWLFIGAVSLNIYDTVKYDLFLSQARIRGYSPEKKKKQRIEEQPLFWNSTDNDLFWNISIKSGEEMRRGFDTWNPMLLPHDLTHDVGVARAT